MFNDPYQIQVETVIVPDEVQIPGNLDADDPLRTKREQQVIYLRNPKNLAGEMKWNTAYDWKVATGVVNGTAAQTHDMGAWIVKDMVCAGAELPWRQLGPIKTAKMFVALRLGWT